MDQSRKAEGETYEVDVGDGKSITPCYDDLSVNTTETNGTCHKQAKLRSERVSLGQIVGIPASGGDAHFLYNNKSLVVTETGVICASVAICRLRNLLAIVL
jgi:hypothetical protein